MNTVKRIYVVVYLVMAVALVAAGINSLVFGHHPIGATGVLLTSLPIVLLLAAAMLSRRLARTAADLPVMTGLAVLGMLLAVWEAHFAGGERDLMLMALAGGAGFLLYVFWYSRFGRVESTVIGVGKHLPDVHLFSTEGTSVSLSDLTGQPAVLIFIRGNWCPLCMGQVNEMAAGIAAFRERGIRVAFIAPQSVSKTAALAAGRPEGLEFYADPVNAAARALAIHHGAGLPLGMEVLGYRSETVLPTVIALKAGGEILWTHQSDNYRVRPRPAEILAVFDAAG